MIYENVCVSIFLISCIPLLSNKHLGERKRRHTRGVRWAKGTIREGGGGKFCQSVLIGKDLANESVFEEAIA